MWELLSPSKLLATNNRQVAQIRTIHFHVDTYVACTAILDEFCGGSQTIRFMPPQMWQVFVVPAHWSLLPGLLPFYKEEQV
jgi:hypothetical protein